MVSDVGFYPDFLRVFVVGTCLPHLFSLSLPAFFEFSFFVTRPFSSSEELFNKFSLRVPLESINEAFIGMTDETQPSLFKTLRTLFLISFSSQRPVFRFSDRSFWNWHRLGWLGLMELHWFPLSHWTRRLLAANGCWLIVRVIILSTALGGQ